MSEPMKKPRTKISIGDRSFTVTRKSAEAILSIVESLDSAEQNIPLDVVFNEAVKNRSKGAVILKGIRTRENMTLKELSKATGIQASNLSSYENGSRKITKSVADKLSKALDVKAHMFLK